MAFAANNILTSWPSVRVASWFEAERDRVFLWVPVCLGVGIAVYFSLPVEPGFYFVAGAGGGALCVWSLVRSFGQNVLLSGLVLSVGGFCLAALHTHLAGTAVVDFKTRPVVLSGWVERVAARQRGERLVIRVFAVKGFTAEKTPYRVRLQNNIKGSSYRAGQAVRMTAVLLPLPEPVQPAGFDFAKKAWFERIGAVGYIVSSAEEPENMPSPPWGLLVRSKIEGVRADISSRIRHVLSERSAGIADALITGNRGGISDEDLVALRRSGLAHILAISGLHMALMAGSLYWLSRGLLALWAPLALLFPIRKWAAMIALMGGFAYLALSGSSLSTVRALVMISVMLLSIIFDRRAFSLRNVAIAATSILLVWPHALFDAGFQMSFAAVTALIGLHEMAQRRHDRLRAGERYRLPTLFRLGLEGAGYFRGVAVTSLIASVAVAPFAAFHFHKLAEFGLIANLAVMPIVAFIVMPAALIGLICMPVGLEWGPLNLMGVGIEWVIDVAHFVQSLSGSVLGVPAIPPLSLGAITLGGLWSLLWQTPMRLMGGALIAVGLMLAATHEAPDVLVERDAKTFAIRSTDGTLSAPKRRGGLYSLEQWLRADGDGRTTSQAQSGKGYKCDLLGCIARVKGRLVSFILHPAALKEDCAVGDIIIVTWPLRTACSENAIIIDKRALQKFGAHALYFERDGVRIETAADWRGLRPWSQ